MTKNNDEPRSKTLLLAVDSTDHGLLLLPHAIRLAQKLHANLQVLYVEDDALLQLAALPFTQELSLYSRERRTLDAPTLRNAYAQRSTELRQYVDQHAANARLTWSMQTLEGRRTDIVLANLHAADLIVVASTAVTSAPMRTVRAAVQQHGAIFVSASGNSENVNAAIALARALDGNSGRIQLVASPGSTVALITNTDLHVAADDSIASLLDVLKSQHAELLIVPMSHPALQQADALLHLLEATPVPLILVPE